MVIPSPPTTPPTMAPTGAELGVGAGSGIGEVAFVVTVEPEDVGCEVLEDVGVIAFTKATWRVASGPHCIQVKPLRGASP